MKKIFALVAVTGEYDTASKDVICVSENKNELYRLCGQFTKWWAGLNPVIINADKKFYDYLSNDEHVILRDFLLTYYENPELILFNVDLHSGITFSVQEVWSV